MLLTSTLDLPGNEYLDAQYDIDRSPRQSEDSYTSHALRGAEYYGSSSMYRLTSPLSDLFYYELRIIIELLGETYMIEDWDLCSTITRLPYDVSSALFDLQLWMQDILYSFEALFSDSVVSRDVLNAASTTKDPRYIGFAACAMEPQLYAPPAPGKVAPWVYDSMVPHNGRSASRICALARRFLDPRSLLLSTLGCSTIIVKEAIRDPQKYGIGALLDDAVFDEYAEACVTTSIYVEGGPVADNMGALLSLYTRDAVIVQLERYMRSCMWDSDYGRDRRDAAKSMLLRSLLLACAPYDLERPTGYAAVTNPHWLARDTCRTQWGFYRHLMQAGCIPGLTLGPNAREGLARHVIMRMYGLCVSEMKEHEKKEYAARYSAIVGPTDIDWLASLMRSTLGLHPGDHRWVIDAMAGKQSGGAGATI